MPRSAGTLAALTAIDHEAIISIIEQLRGFHGEGPDLWDEQLLETHSAAIATLHLAADALAALHQLLERPAPEPEEEEPTA